MKAVEITELPEVEVSEEGLIPIVDPLNGVSRVKLKHARGLSIQSQETFFLVTDVNTGVDISTSGWETTPSNTTGDNRYLWSYSKFTYNDGHILNTPPAVIGVYGDTGNGILSSEYYYLATSKSTDVTKDEAGWTTTPQQTSNTEKYLWSYVHTEYTDGTQTDSTPVVIGTHGDKGDVGKPFTIAKTYTSIDEMNNAFATDGVEEGSFVVIDTGDINDEDNAKLYLKGSTAYMYITDMSGIQGLQGPKGDKGDTGATGLQGPKGDKGDSIPIDSALSSSSTNAVQNKVVNSALSARPARYTTTLLDGGFVSAQGGYISLLNFWTKLVDKYGTNAEVLFAWDTSESGYVSIDGTSSTNKVNLSGSTVIYRCNTKPSSAWSNFHAIIIPSGSITDPYIISATTSETAGTLSSKRIYTIGGLSIKDTVYIQFRGQSSPQDLFGGTWQNISSTYAGRFFRAEGGTAASFGSQQNAGLPNIKGTYIRDSTQNTYEGAWSGAFRGANFITGRGSGDSIGTFYGARTLNFDASLSNSLYGASSEVRPINETFRIWKRTA